MIVIGSFTSANSKRLTQLALEKNPRSHQVTCGEDINEEWFKNVNVVGISAGASTPDSIINEVTEKIRKIGNVLKAISDNTVIFFVKRLASRSKDFCIYLF